MSNKSQDIFHVLNHLADGNFEFFATVNEQFFKDVNPYVTLLWAQGASENEDVITVLLDEVVNKHFFAFSKHPRLQMLLLCSALKDTHPGRFKFIQPPKEEMNKEVEAVVREFYVAPDVARTYLQLMDDDTISTLMDKHKEAIQ